MEEQQGRQHRELSRGLHKLEGAVDDLRGTLEDKVGWLPETHRGSAQVALAPAEGRRDCSGQGGVAASHAQRSAPVALSAPAEGLRVCSHPVLPQRGCCRLCCVPAQSPHAHLCSLPEALRAPHLLTDQEWLQVNVEDFMRLEQAAASAASLESTASNLRADLSALHNSQARRHGAAESVDRKLEEVQRRQEAQGQHTAEALKALR